MRTQKCIIIIILVEILIIELDKLLLFGGRESSHECRYKLHCRMPDSHSSLQQNIPTQNWKFALAYGLLLIKWDINSSQRHTHRCYCVTADLKLKYIQDPLWAHNESGSAFTWRFEPMGGGATLILSWSMRGRTSQHHRSGSPVLAFPYSHIRLPNAGHQISSCPLGTRHHYSFPYHHYKNN